MVNFVKYTLAAAVFGMLGACSSSVDCDVVTYHSLERPSGERISVVADELNVSDPDLYANVAGQVETALLKAGYSSAGGGEADLVFAVRYGVGTGPDEMKRVPRCSNRYVFKGDNYGSPYYRGLECYEEAPEAVNNYIHYLEIKVFDPVSAATGNSATIYEGLAQSLSWSDDIEQLMPYLVTALFDNFPGRSGEIRSVAVDFNRPE